MTFEKADNRSARKPNEENPIVSKIKDARLDLRGLKVKPQDSSRVDEAIQTVHRHLGFMSGLAEGLQKEGFNLHTDVRPFNKESDIPGSITVLIERNGIVRRIYGQTFGASFLDNFQDEFPFAKSFDIKIEQAKREIAEEEQKKNRPEFQKAA